MTYLPGNGDGEFAPSSDVLNGREIPYTVDPFIEPALAHPGPRKVEPASPETDRPSSTVILLLVPIFLIGYVVYQWLDWGRIEPQGIPIIVFALALGAMLYLTTMGPSSKHRHLVTHGTAVIGQVTAKATAGHGRARRCILNYRYPVGREILHASTHVNDAQFNSALVGEPIIVVHDAKISDSMIYKYGLYKIKSSPDQAGFVDD